MSKAASFQTIAILALPALCRWAGLNIGDRDLNNNATASFNKPLSTVSEDVVLPAMRQMRRGPQMVPHDRHRHLRTTFTTPLASLAPRSDRCSFQQMDSDMLTTSSRLQTDM